jgi:hypothetical protein
MFDSEGGLDFATKGKFSVFINQTSLKNGKYKYDLSFFSLKFSVAAGNGPFLNTNYGASPSWLESPFIPGWVGSPCVCTHQIYGRENLK